jgi:prepilin-type N-terminal cleavage/methylation domain-containing protein
MAEKLQEAAGSERGFTLVEGLVAMAILLVVAIGIIPLFASSILNNIKGSDSTLAANFSKTNVESLSRMPFTNPALTIASGSTQKKTDDWWKPGNGRINDPSQGWQAGRPTAGPLNSWTRNTIVEQYGLADILNFGTPTTPLDGSTQPNFVQLKMVTVNVQSSKPGGILGNGERITVQSLKAF